MRSQLFLGRKKTTNNEMCHDLQQLELFSNHSAFDFSFQEPSGLISFVNLNCLICQRKKTTNNEMCHDLQQLELFSNHSAFDFSFQEPSGLISFVNLNCLICHKLFLMLAF